MDETDTERLARYRAGDTKALDGLVEKYRRPLFGFILNMTGAQENADEVFQEVWFRVIRKLADYEEGNFFGWLIRIAHNLIIDRGRRKRPSVSLDEELSDGTARMDLLASDGPAPWDAMEREDLRGELAKAVAKLPEEQKEVFLLRVQGDVSFKEIARIQKVSINTALGRMHYALAKLRNELKEYAQR